MFQLPWKVLAAASDQERDALFHLQNTLAGLASAATQFRHGVELIQCCSQEYRRLWTSRPKRSRDGPYLGEAAERYREQRAAWAERLDQQNEWAKHSARSCVLIVAGLVGTIDQLTHIVKLCPSVQDRVGGTGRRQARKTLQTAFPQLTLARDMLAHPFETYANPVERERNKITGNADFGGISFRGQGTAIISEASSMGEDSFTLTGTFKEKVVSIVIGPEQLEAISFAISEVWSDFQFA